MKTNQNNSINPIVIESAKKTLTKHKRAFEVLGND